MPWNPEIDEYEDNRGSVIIEKQTLMFDTFDLVDGEIPQEVTDCLAENQC